MVKRRPPGPGHRGDVPRHGRRSSPAPQPSATPAPSHPYARPSRRRACTLEWPTAPTGPKCHRRRRPAPPRTRKNPGRKRRRTRAGHATAREQNRLPDTLAPHRDEPTLLLVAGDLGVSATLTAALTPTWRIVSALSPGDVIRRLTMPPPALAVFETQLEGVDSRPLLRALHARHPACPAVIVTDDLPSAGSFATDNIAGLFHTRAFWTLLGNLKAGASWPAADALPRAITAQVADVIDYVRRNYGRACTVADIAAAVAMSDSSVAHRFRAETGVSIRDHVIRVRVAVAKLLLAHTRDKLEQIAEHTGFCDAPHLCRTFRRLEARAPREWAADASTRIDPA